MTDQQLFLFPGYHLGARRLPEVFRTEHTGETLREHLGAQTHP